MPISKKRAHFFAIFILHSRESELYQSMCLFVLNFVCFSIEKGLDLVFCKKALCHFGYGKK